jgi:hypothetical protein
MEIGVKKINIQTPETHKLHNASTSFIQNLTKNIEKMIKHVKETDSNHKEIEFRTLISQQPMETPDISNIELERMHTSPEPAHSDSYGLTHRSPPTKTKKEPKHSKLK